MDIDEPNGREKHDHYRGRSPTRDRDRERKHERHHRYANLCELPIGVVVTELSLVFLEVLDLCSIDISFYGNENQEVRANWDMFI